MGHTLGRRERLSFEFRIPGFEFRSQRSEGEALNPKLETRNFQFVCNQYRP